MDLRYGMNPHLDARVVSGAHDGPAKVCHGEPSYINLLDALSGWQLVRDASIAMGKAVAASFKHVSPAGAAAVGPLDATACESWGIDSTAGPLVSAYLRARDADPKSSFGDMIAVSEPVDAELADLLSRVVADGIIAPGFDTGTVGVLARKKRGTFLVLEADPAFQQPEWERRDVFGLVVEQQRDRTPVIADLLAPAKVAPDKVIDALLGLVTMRYTQSNSVAVVKDGMTLGIGAGQQNRVDCVRLAASKVRTWWLRRHDVVRSLPHVTDMSRQERLNWQIRLADTDMTAAQLTEFARLFPGVTSRLTESARSDWVGQLDHLTLVSDGFLPFRDNIDHASRIGVRHVVEPGGSSRSDEVATACAEYGITLTRTGLRLFHH
ncbi:MAG TPA: phosphoribosylaminoimidazolecarboxamide formyltransferase [Amycolatopsis sp.]|nr:phosphoribosylaminoimidazolecarboxamide formyltransferase [Amycolatopsis sp.]